MEAIRTAPVFCSGFPLKPITYKTLSGDIAFIGDPAVVMRDKVAIDGIHFLTKYNESNEPHMRLHR
jgi:hypothetical protein